MALLGSPNLPSEARVLRDGCSPLKKCPLLSASWGKPRPGGRCQERPAFFAPLRYPAGGHLLREPPGVLGPFNPPQHALKLFTVESRRGFDSLLPGFKGPFTESPCFCSLGLGERKRTASGFNPP
jgi:hypothetical protein